MPTPKLKPKLGHCVYLVELTAVPILDSDTSAYSYSPASTPTWSLFRTQISPWDRSRANMGSKTHGYAAQQRLDPTQTSLAVFRQTEVGV